MSGPSHAEEVIRGIPTAVVAASLSKSVAEKVQDFFMSSNFRVYTNTDITGVELGGALKNIIAICSGISDGLGFGDNTRAALMTRGIVEITRLGIRLGAMPATFSGLSGIGDLIVTCNSNHSRNRKAGIDIGRGKTLREIISYLVRNYNYIFDEIVADIADEVKEILDNEYEENYCRDKYHKSRIFIG